MRRCAEMKAHEPSTARGVKRETAHIFEDDVVRGNAIRCDEEQKIRVGGRVDVADFALGEQLQVAQITVNERRRSHCVHRMRRTWVRESVK